MAPVDVIGLNWMKDVTRSLASASYAVRVFNRQTQNGVYALSFFA